MTLDQQTARGPVLTPAAADKVKAFIDEDGGQNLMLRVAVVMGGCSGPRYQVGLDDRVLEGDVREHWHGVDVVVDSASASYLATATIDWAERPTEQGFTIDNPTMLDDDCECGCGCGDGC